jgi:hypothetical protein
MEVGMKEKEKDKKKKKPMTTPFSLGSPLLRGGVQGESRVIEEETSPLSTPYSLLKVKPTEVKLPLAPTEAEQVVPQVAPEVVPQVAPEVVPQVAPRPRFYVEKPADVMPDVVENIEAGKTPEEVSVKPEDAETRAKQTDDVVQAVLNSILEASGEEGVKKLKLPEDQIAIAQEEQNALLANVDEEVAEKMGTRAYRLLEKIYPDAEAMLYKSELNKALDNYLTIEEARGRATAGKQASIQGQQVIEQGAYIPPLEGLSNFLQNMARYEAGMTEADVNKATKELIEQEQARPKTPAEAEANETTADYLFKYFDKTEEGIKPVLEPIVAELAREVTESGLPAAPEDFVPPKNAPELTEAAVNFIYGIVGLKPGKGLSLSNEDAINAVIYYFLQLGKYPWLKSSKPNPTLPGYVPEEEKGKKKAPGYLESTIAPFVSLWHQTPWGGEH